LSIDTQALSTLVLDWELLKIARLARIFPTFQDICFVLKYCHERVC